MFKLFKPMILVSLLIWNSAFALSGAHPGQIQDDSDLVSAVQSRRNVYYLEAANLVVTGLLPDDSSGNKHQKWTARLSNGSVVTVIYNLDLSPRVPLRIGDKFGVGGQYIQTGKTGLVHWVHSDPRQKRPDGYVYYKGIVYGDLTQGH